MSRHIRRNHSGYRVGEDHHRARMSDEAVSRAIQLRQIGLSYRAIGEAVGASQWTVRDWCQGWTRWAR